MTPEEKALIAFWGDYNSNFRFDWEVRKLTEEEKAAAKARTNKSKQAFVDALVASRIQVARLVEAWNASEPEARKELVATPNYHHRIENLLLVLTDLRDSMHPIQENEES